MSIPSLRRLLTAALLAVPCTAHAQFSSPPGVPIPTIVQVRSPEGVTATNALVRLLGYDVERYTDSDGRAVLPALPRGDFLILLQSPTEGSSLRGVSANGVADTVRVRLARRVPTISTYGMTNVLTEPLAAAAQRRFRRLGGVLAGARLQRFRTIGDAALFLSGAADPQPHTCLRIGEQGAAPPGSALLRAAETPESGVVGSLPVPDRPSGETTTEDLEALAASPEGLEAMEWIDARSVPVAFTGIPAGCQVVMLWR